MSGAFVIATTAIRALSCEEILNGYLINGLLRASFREAQTEKEITEHQKIIPNVVRSHVSRFQKRVFLESWLRLKAKATKSVAIHIRQCCGDMHDASIFPLAVTTFALCERMWRDKTNFSVYRCFEQNGEYHVLSQALFN